MSSALFGLAAWSFWRYCGLLASRYRSHRPIPTAGLHDAGSVVDWRTGHADLGMWAALFWPFERGGLEVGMATLALTGLQTSSSRLRGLAVYACPLCSHWAFVSRVGPHSLGAFVAWRLFGRWVSVLAVWPRLDCRAQDMRWVRAASWCRWYGWGWQPSPSQAPSLQHCSTPVVRC